MSSIVPENLTNYIKEHGISLEEAERQLKLFRKGTQPVDLDRAATIGDGILKVGKDELDKLNKIFDSGAQKSRVMKFVPASGAASRMFRDLESMLNKYDDISPETLESVEPENVFTKTFIERIRDFAFWEDLKVVLQSDGMTSGELIDKGIYRPLIEYTLRENGLNYSNKPKALIKFHKYDDGARTSFEEHLAEGLVYAKQEGGKVLIHFTISPEFQNEFDALLENLREKYEKDGITLDVSFSEQEKSTDTLAADMNNEPFLDEDGKPVFRPGGHGALLNNLDRLEADLVFIKNIDNIVPERLRDETYLYKKAIGGKLIEVRDKVFSHLRKIDAADFSTLDEAAAFAQNELNITLSDSFSSKTELGKAEELKELLNRPIRVCAMVVNEGEPGGGPFWVRQKDGTITLQIVETSQIDLENPDQKKIMEQSTHFNPTDLVCCVTNYEGKPFNLNDFKDPDTSFIANKSKDGRQLKALELPGLWNGAMAHWINVFMEAPVITFNPVKTINDLLREQHQS